MSSENSEISPEIPREGKHITRAMLAINEERESAFEPTEFSLQQEGILDERVTVPANPPFKRADTF